MNRSFQLSKFVPNDDHGQANLFNLVNFFLLRNKL